MAKTVKETKVVNGIEYAVVEAIVKDGEKETPITYLIPATPAAFRSLVQGVEEGALETIYGRYCYATDLKERAAHRESTAVTKPEIATKKYGKLNLVDGTFEGTNENPWKGTALPLENRVKVINAALLMAQAKEETAPRAVLKAREELLTGKQCIEQNGVLRIAK